MTSAPAPQPVRIIAVGGSPALRRLRSDTRFDLARCSDACEMLMLAAGLQSPPHALLFDARSSAGIDLRLVSDAAEEAGLPAPITLPDEATPDEVLRTIAPEGLDTLQDEREPQSGTAPQTESRQEHDDESRPDQYPGEQQPREREAQATAEPAHTDRVHRETPEAVLESVASASAVTESSGQTGVGPLIGRLATGLLKGRSLSDQAVDELSSQLGLPVRVADEAANVSPLVACIPLEHASAPVGTLIGPSSAASELREAAPGIAAARAWDLQQAALPVADHRDALTGLPTEPALIGALAGRIEAGRRTRQGFALRLHRVSAPTHAALREAASVLSRACYILGPDLLAAIEPDQANAEAPQGASASFPWDAHTPESLLACARARLGAG